MTHLPALILCVAAAGLAFDFVNGFHDAANSIATIVATRVFKPLHAVLWAAFFNVVAVFFFGTGVAKTVGSGMVDPHSVTPLVVLCGLAGATLWGLITWRARLPTSSSHALIGGYAGAALAHVFFVGGLAGMAGTLIAAGWIKVLAFIVVAPALGLVLSWASMLVALWAQKRYEVSKDSVVYRRLQLLSSAFLSLMHGSNDAQKTAGIIASALLAGGVTSSFIIPDWVLGLSYVTMGLGTLCGGWRIVRTMGSRLTRVDPLGGVCAESSAALSVLAATLLDLPVSTTHVTTGAILGVGVAIAPGKVRWKMARRIAWAWVLTIPASSAIGGFVMGVAAWCGY